MQDRVSGPSRHSLLGEAEQSVRIEVFAHGALGKEVVLVASLSNSVLLVIRISGGDGGRAESGGLRSWLLDWPVAGKVGAVDLLAMIVCLQEALCYCGCTVRAVDNKQLALAIKGCRYKSPGLGLC